MKKVAVLQSNYIPWKGYFDIIHDVELFIFHDDLQYTKNDWRNRNKIRLLNGTDKWLTVPVGTDEKRLIDQVKIKDFSWQKDHFNNIIMNYKKSPFFYRYREFLEFVYLDKKWEYLYQLNRFLIENISKKYLGIKTEFSDSREYKTIGAKSEKLLSLLKASDTDIYVSGPAAKNYINEEEYEKNNIKVVWKDYSGYPEYKQLYGEFNHNVSILDLLFNTGDEAPYYIWGWRESK